MKNILKRSRIPLGSPDVVLTTIAILFDRPFSLIFVDYDGTLLDVTARAFSVCKIPFLIMWFNMYVSALFTTLNGRCNISGNILYACTGFASDLHYCHALDLATRRCVTLSCGMRSLRCFVSLFSLLENRNKYHFCSWYSLNQSLIIDAVCVILEKSIFIVIQF